MVFFEGGEGRFVLYSLRSLQSSLGTSDNMAAWMERYFCLSELGEGAAGISWVETVEAVNHPTKPRMASPQNYSVPNFSGAAIHKGKLEGILLSYIKEKGGDGGKNS